MMDTFEFALSYTSRITYTVGCFASEISIKNKDFYFSGLTQCAWALGGHTKGELNHLLRRPFAGKKVLNLNLCTYF